MFEFAQSQPKGSPIVEENTTIWWNPFRCGDVELRTEQECLLLLSVLDELRICDNFDDTATFAPALSSMPPIMAILAVTCKDKRLQALTFEHRLLVALLATIPASNRVSPFSAFALGLEDSLFEDKEEIVAGFRLLRAAFDTAQPLRSD